MFAFIRRLFGALMSTTDQFNVTYALTPANPKTGDLITITISGDDVQTTTTAGTGGPLILHLAAADGATLDLNVPAFPIQIVVATHESVKIAGITDLANPNRAWAIINNGLSITTTG